MLFQNKTLRSAADRETALRMLSLLKQGKDARVGKVRNARRSIRTGKMDSKVKLEKALDIMIDREFSI